MTSSVRISLLAAVVFHLLVVGTLSAHAEGLPNAKPAERKRPKINLRGTPTIGQAPLRVTLSAELTGGSEDFEEYYCPTVVWEWTRGSSSESTSDCDPYEPGRSEIKRRYSVEHTFRNYGVYRVYFTLMHRNKPLGSALINILVQPGLFSMLRSPSAPAWSGEPH